MKRLVIMIIMLAFCLSIMFVGCTKENMVEDAVAAFTSDELQGRLAGHEGNEKAVAYMQDWFKKLGLEYLNGDSYLSPFKAETYDTQDADIQLEVRFEDNTSYHCKYGDDFLEQNDLRFLDICAPATFDPMDQDLGSKILILEDKEKISQVYNKAKGILVKSEVFKNNTVLREQGTPIYQISEALYNRLKTGRIKSILFKSSIKKAASEVNNVIGVIPGKDRSKAIVISAHIDHVGFAGKTIFRGAVDNASGGAVMLKVASILKAEADKGMFPQDIVFCALNAEESGLLGSKAIVPLLKDKYKSLYNINLDTLGIKNEAGILIEGDDEFNKELKADLSKFLSSKNYKVDTESIGLTSDNASFEHENICAVNIGQTNIKLLHSEKDNIDNLDVDFLQKLSEDIAQFIIVNKDKTYQSNRQNGGSSSGNTSLQEADYEQLSKLVQEERKSLQFDEFKIIEFKGSKIVITGSSDIADPSSIKKYYPTIKLTEKVEDYTLAGIWLHFISKNHEGEIINPMDKKYTLDTIYKRNVSKENIVSASLKYTKGETALHIEIYKEHPQIKREWPFDLATLNKLSIDERYYIRNDEFSLSLVRQFKADANSYVIRVFPGFFDRSLSEQDAANTIYNGLKVFDLEELTRQIFIQQ